MIVVVVTVPFFDEFWPALAAGLIVLLVGYLAIDRLLGLRERATNERRTREGVLRIVHNELLHNASQHTTCREELPKMQIPFPGFELGGWHLVSQMAALLTVSPETTDLLVHA
jgi:hypothetical protein